MLIRVHLDLRGWTTTDFSIHIHLFAFKFLSWDILICRCLSLNHTKQTSEHLRPTMGDLSLGKIQAALASATNEVTIAAANINFDFAVFKYDAPAEYQPLSTALTNHRRQNAEFGEIHVTARRLATLFDGVCPSTPKLLKAYGTRASQICESESGNSAKSKAGLFGEYIGVDATSIWASATSSRSGNAIHIHLLACLLARIWSHSEAVSIWDQIITSRREEIAHKFMDSGSIPFATLSAATQQPISLSSLAAWDASARAWLRTADASKMKEQTQFFLIFRNLTMAINEDGRVYDSILSAWTGGLQTLEGLIDGAPHNIRDGSVLLAISAWHIYPDIMVFGVDKTAASTEVVMQDELVAEGGTISVGLSRFERGDLNAEVPRGGGIYWSMPLDRLKYYGKSVRRTRNLLDDGCRISFTDLLQVNLGAMFAQWGVPQRPRLEYIDMIIKIISFQASDHPLKPIEWSSVILDPALEYLQDTVKGDALFDLGSRRKEFSSIDGQGHGLFGLQSIMNLQSLLVGEAETIKFLLYLFNQRLPNIQDALILTDPEALLQHRKMLQEGCYWLTQIQQCQSPETTAAAIRQQGSSRPRRSLNLQTLFPRFLHDNGIWYYPFVGNPGIAAIFVSEDVLRQNLDLRTSSRRDLSLQELKWCFDSNVVSSERLARYLSRRPGSEQFSFLHTLSKVYSSESMKGSTISCSVFDRPLLRPWKRAHHPWPTDQERQRLDIQKAEYVIPTMCYLETGSQGVESLPGSTLRSVIAFSVGDSIFVRSEVSLERFQDIPCTYENSLKTRAT